MSIVCILEAAFLISALAERVQRPPPRHSAQQTSPSSSIDSGYLPQLLDSSTPSLLPFRQAITQYPDAFAEPFDFWP